MKRLMLSLLLTLSLPFLTSTGVVRADGYTVSYPNGTRVAVEFYKKNHDALKETMPGVSESMLKVIYSIVAPEVSQYDPLENFFEVKALEMKYVKDGSCNYSIGRFQMKPGFVESLEKEVFSNASLKKKFGKFMEYAKGKSGASVRKERLKRMRETEWQMRYLAVFVEVVKRRTAKWGLKSNEDKVRCWATLYNAGTYLSRQRVTNRQKVKRFPGNTNEFNYSEVAVELYRRLDE